MQFLKSLFCFKGFDNRSRFFTLCSAAYITFIILTSAFENSLVIQLILLVLFSIVIAFTSLRRLQDAKLNKKWLLAPSLSFALIALFIVLSIHSNYYLLFISALGTSTLLTYPSKAGVSYILGYYGPVDLKEYLHHTNPNMQSSSRIEPSLFSENNANLNSANDASITINEHNQYSFTQPPASVNNNADIGEMIRLKLIKNKRAQFIIAGLLGITVIIFATTWLIKNLNGETEVTPNKTLQQQSVNTHSELNRSDPLAMPDNYTLYLSQHGGISINWQADEVSENILWSQLSGEGDKTCQQITFNKGDAIRTLTVQVDSSSGLNNNYFADFSPLDSQALIQALAFRGSFTLCGYDFSLKGSQAALGQNAQYAQWIEY